MRLLITTDAVGGVWTYTQELTTQLAQRGHVVHVVCFGPEPTEKQCAWTKTLPQVSFRALPYKLEWMAGCESDIEEARSDLSKILGELKPDLLHSNQFCFGDVASTVPRVVIAHSDVVSWWHAVHGCDPTPAEFPHIEFYREVVSRGLARADATVAISCDVRAQLQRHYAASANCGVVYNGVDPARFTHDRAKANHALCVGRFWDKAKNLAIVENARSKMPIRIAGDERGLGVLDADELREEYAEARIYLHPALYEPFGLAPLEAAFSGCALLLSDIGSLREIWGEHATYFDPHDAIDLADKLGSLQTKGAREHALAHYTAERMADDYLALYRELIGSKAVSA